MANKQSCYSASQITDFAANLIEDVFNQLKESGRTQKLWAQYHKYVGYIRDFIRAERLSDYALHLKTICKMMPIMAAGGHGQYAKAIRLTLEMVYR